MRPATGDDINAMAEPYYEYVLSDLAANTPTTVITWDLDKDEKVIPRWFGTNGGANITLETRNKRNPLGDPINGINCPVMPREDWYELDVLNIFEEGDTFNLVATAAAAANNIKFFVKGMKVEPS